MNKKFLHKIYDKDDNYITTWSQENDVMNVPNFSWGINQGMGNMVIQLARRVDSFGENADVKLYNRVQTFIHDDDSPAGTKIFDGNILSYEPTISESGEQYINVNVFSQSTTLMDRLLKDGDNTTINYTNVTPDVIIKNILTKYGGTITYNAGSITPVSTVLSYTYKYITCFDAIKKALDMTDAFMFWFINAENIFHLKNPDWDNTEHTLFIGKQINSMSAKKSVETYYSDIYFLGGGDPCLYRLYSNAGAQSNFKERHYQMRDGRVTVANTAEQMAYKFLDENSQPVSEMTVTVLDNSINKTKGYDIESFKPGDVVRVKNSQVKTRYTLWDDFIWDVDFWDYDLLSSMGQTMQIRSINYKFNEIELQLASKPQQLHERIINIDKNLEVMESENIPDAPT